MKEMRLIDAEGFAEVIRAKRDTAQRQQDIRAAAALSWVLAELESTPTLFLRPNEEKNKKHKYGKYRNVLFTDEELEKLQDEFPNDWQARIEEVSAYVASSGKTYKNFLAVIRNWARRDEKEKPPERESSFETDEFFELAKKKTYGDGRKS